MFFQTPLFISYCPFSNGEPSYVEHYAQHNSHIILFWYNYYLHSVVQEREAKLWGLFSQDHRARAFANMVPGCSLLITTVFCLETTHHCVVMDPKLEPKGSGFLVTRVIIRPSTEGNQLVKMFFIASQLSPSTWTNMELLRVALYPGTQSTS